MKDKQNEFYSSIAAFYHEIFPYNQAQMNFIARNSGNLEGKRMLDIGCATGELAYHLAGKGAIVTGIDLNDELLNQAIQNKIHPNLSFRKADMLELNQVFKLRQFDSVVCFGNTLVHLISFSLVEKMLNGVSEILKPGADFFMQILNYDYILEENVAELPIIETENIQFMRRYAFEENAPLIHFITRLYLKKENTFIENETILLAIKSKELKKLLENAGFTNVQMFSNFKEDKFGGNHLPLVLKAKNQY